MNSVDHSTDHQHRGLKCLGDWFKEGLDNEKMALLHYLPVGTRWLKLKGLSRREKQLCSLKMTWLLKMPRMFSGENFTLFSACFEKWDSSRRNAVKDLKNILTRPRPAGGGEER